MRKITDIDRTIPVDVIEKLKEAEAEIERGEGIPYDIAYSMLQEKYGF